jgi:hypothetical protein
MFKIVNIHIPKCGGTSFRKSLSDHYNIHLDYGNKISRQKEQIIKESVNFNQNINLNDFTNIDCISGHVIPIKYKKLYDNDWKFITWLREPSLMLYSKFYHIKRGDYVNNNTTNKKELTIGEYVTKNVLSLENFLLDPITKNFYQRFFYDFPLENYFFIGVVENYQSDLKYLSYLLGINLNMNNENINPNKKDDLYKIDNNLLDKIKEFHSEDYELYYKILEKSNKRK